MPILFHLPQPMPALLTIPGVTARGNIIVCPENAAGVVEAELHAAPMKFTKQVKSAKVEVSGRPEILRPTVDDKPLGQWLMPHQKKAVAFSVKQVGSLLLHTAGSGKSASAIIWAAADDGKCLWITRAISKISHQREMERLTTARTQIIDGIFPSCLEVKAYRSNARLLKGAALYLRGPDGGKTHDGGTLTLSDDGFCAVTEGELKPGGYQLCVETVKAGTLTVPIWIRKGLCTRVVIQMNEPTKTWPEIKPPSYIVEIEPILDPLAKFYIINWEILHAWWPRLVGNYSSVVFDEIHRAKSAVRHVAAYNARKNTTRFLAKNNISYSAMRISRKATRRLGLTGTLVKNTVGDVWSPLDLLLPYQFGSRASFMERYANRHVGTYGQIDDKGSSNLDELRTRIMAIAHRATAKETHKFLPPLRRQSHVIPASEQMTVSERRFAKELGGGSVLEQKVMLAATRKRKAVFELVEDGVEANQHVAVFTGRRADAEDLANSIRKKLGKKMRGPIIMIHGGIPVAKRDALRVAYMNARGAAVLIATGDSMGEAIDLNKTDHAIFAMLPYTWEQLEQREKRFWRLGQDRPVIIHYLIAAGTIDERIASLLLNKLPPVEKIGQSDDIGAMKQAVMGGKSGAEIEAELVDFILSGAA